MENARSASLGFHSGPSRRRRGFYREAQCPTARGRTRGGCLCPDPTRNLHRFYRLDVQPDLFGGVLLVKQWGRIGAQGRMVAESYDSEALAADALQRHAERKRRRGYALGPWRTGSLTAPRRSRKPSSIPRRLSTTRLTLQEPSHCRAVADENSRSAPRLLASKTKQRLPIIGYGGTRTGLYIYSLK